MTVEKPKTVGNPNQTAKLKRVANPQPGKNSKQVLKHALKAKTVVNPRDAAIKKLDDAIASARPLGSPIWHQQGIGGWLPNKTKHELFHDNLNQGARLDTFSRSTVR